MTRKSVSKRVQVAIPVDDLVTQSWLNAQNNMSFSIRYLIREHVRETGEYIDVMSVGLPDVETPPLPRNVVKEFSKTASKESVEPKLQETKTEKVENKPKPKATPKPERKVESKQAESASAGIELDMDVITSMQGDSSDGENASSGEAVKDIKNLMDAK